MTVFVTLTCDVMLILTLDLKNKNKIKKKLSPMFMILTYGYSMFAL